MIFMTAKLEITKLKYVEVVPLQLKKKQTNNKKKKPFESENHIMFKLQN